MTWLSRNCWCSTLQLHGADSESLASYSEWPGCQEIADAQHESHHPRLHHFIVDLKSGVKYFEEKTKGGLGKFKFGFIDLHKAAVNNKRKPIWVVAIKCNRQRNRLILISLLLTGDATLLSVTTYFEKLHSVFVLTTIALLPYSGFFSFNFLFSLHPPAALLEVIVRYLYWSPNSYAFPAGQTFPLSASLE